MTQPILSILIPTVNGRESECANLGNYCIRQFEQLGQKWVYATQIKEGIEAFRTTYTECEIVTYRDDKIITIGEKREWLYQKAKGKFSLMLDDDDSILDNAIQLILEAIKSNPEIPCITFKERCMINGIYKSSNHSIIYSQWMDNSDGYDYIRCPFYKDVIRTDIAKSVPFEHIRYNEDERWSMAIKPFLDQEIHLEEEIYHYIYNETNHEIRYGFK